MTAWISIQTVIASNESSIKPCLHNYHKIKIDFEQGEAIAENKQSIF